MDSSMKEPSELQQLKEQLEVLKEIHEDLRSRLAKTQEELESINKEKVELEASLIESKNQSREIEQLLIQGNKVISQFFSNYQQNIKSMDMNVVPWLCLGIDAGQGTPQKMEQPSNFEGILEESECDEDKES
jgi:predicted  nucleic acid-binding Zn-ribbon protein